MHGGRGRGRNKAFGRKTIPGQYHTGPLETGWGLATITGATNDHFCWRRSEKVISPVWSDVYSSGFHSLPLWLWLELSQTERSPMLLTVGQLETISNEPISIRVREWFISQDNGRQTGALRSGGWRVGWGFRGPAGRETSAPNEWGLPITHMSPGFTTRKTFTTPSSCWSTACSALGWTFALIKTSATWRIGQRGVRGVGGNLEGQYSDYFFGFSYCWSTLRVY